MCFIGNDIISLTDNPNRKSFSNPEYLRKVLTCKEFLLLEQSRDVQYLPYLFWTCKESVYKIAMKAGMNKVFVPHKFEVNPENVFTVDGVINTSGSVTCDNDICYFQSQIFPEYIYTSACSNQINLPLIQGYVGKNSIINQHTKIRETLKSELATYYKKDIEHFEILKTEKGIPYIHSPFSINMPDVSFSYDSSYFSYAVLFS
jgi:phosphopantetheinyl transferase (holo-ACP synthase)